MKESISLILIFFLLSCNDGKTITTKTDSVAQSVIHTDSVTISNVAMQPHRIDSPSRSGVKRISLKRELSMLSEYLKRFEIPAQHFKISSTEPSKVTGAKGTIISIDPRKLKRADGQPLDKDIDIELKELTNVEDFARERASTIFSYDSRMLVSGGAYYLKITSGGEELKPSSSESVKVNLVKYTDERMSQFRGVKDSLGRLSWIGMEAPRFSAFSKYADTTVLKKMSDQDKIKFRREKKLYDNVYNAISFREWNWINCDHFLAELNLTSLFVEFEKNSGFSCASVSLAFTGINSLLENTFQVASHENGFPNIPFGYKVVLIAIAVKDGKAYTYKSNLKITSNQKVTIKLTETPEKDLATLFTLNK